MVDPAGRYLLRALCLCALLTAAVTGCRKAPAASDADLAASIQSVLLGDSALANQPVQVKVQSGVATLTGSVINDAQRTLAARDAAAVPGVQKVVDEIGINTMPPVSASVVTPPPPAPVLAPVPRARELVKPSPRSNQPHLPAPIERSQPADNPQPAYNPPPPPPAPAPVAAAPPTPPPAPTFKTITIAAGNAIPVRVTQTLDSGTTQPDTTFSGVVASDIVIDGVVAIPAGANVSGHVDEVKDAAHFKGSSSLTVSLTQVSRRGEHIAVTTDPYTVTGKGRGANTAEKTGGGAAVGAILGGIFGGGKGAAIGAAAGAGAGAGSNAITRGQQVQIASESVVRFHLSAPITLRVRLDSPEHHGDDSSLQPRNP